MSSTNKTTNYLLPQFISTDKPTWLGDFNSAMSSIDAQMKNNADAASAAAATASAAATSAALNALSDEVDALAGSVSTLQSDLLKIRVYNGEYTTGTLTGNSNHNLTVPLPANAQTVLAVIPVGFDPSSSWATQIFFDAAQTTGAIRLRCQGSTNQYYTIRYVVIYTVS